MSLETLAPAWLAGMWRACWQGTIAILLVWLVCRVLLRKASPSARAALWWVACLKCLASLMIGAAIAVPVLAPQSNTLLNIDDHLEALAPGTSKHAARTQEPTVQQHQTMVTQSSPFLWPQATFAIWALGLLGVGFWTLRQGARVRSLLRESKPLNDSPIGEQARSMGAVLGLDAMPRVVESSEVTAPLVVGFWQSTVILPAGFTSQFSREEARMALAHELAHVRRRDLIVGLVPTLCQVLFFFFPPMWLAIREWSLEREAACDAEALAATSGTPSGYGQMLMKIVTRDHQGGLTPALGATNSYHTLRKRLEMIKSFVHPRRRTRFLTAGLLGLGLLLAMPWQLTAHAAPPPAEKNLLKNASFEEGQDGLANWQQASLPDGADTGVATSIDTSVGHTGKASLKFEKSRVSFFPVAVVAQTIPLDASQKKLKVSMWVKAQGARKATMAVMYGGGSGKIDWGAYVGEAKAGDSPASHDWKKYGAVLAIPSGISSITVALEMYGPGTVWIDDVNAQYVPADTPIKAAVAMDEGDSDPLADIKDVPNQSLKAGNDPDKQYFLIGPKPGADIKAYKLLVVLPGGDGSADFNPFVRRVWKNVLPEDFIIAELVAPKWAPDQFNQIVWPTSIVQFHGMKFSTEDFVEAVVKDVSKKYKIDPNKVFSFSWSSGGPAGYSEGLSDGAVKGSLVAMSVFHPNQLPPMVGGQGHAFYILHSPDDQLIPLDQAQEAEQELKKAGAKVKLVTYPGGHGFASGAYEMIQAGIQWLDKETSE